MKNLKKFLIGFLAASALIFVSCPQPNSGDGGGTGTEENISVEKVNFDRAAGEVEAGTVVKLSSATDGAEIYYSTANALSSENYESGTKYTDAGITITEAVTVHAIAVFTSTATGKKYFSEPSSAAYTIKSFSVAPVVFDKTAGPVLAGDVVKLSSATDGAEIYYSTANALSSENYELGTKYTDAGITITEAVTVHTIAVLTSTETSKKYFSEPSSAAYTIENINVAGVIFDKAAGALTPGTLVKLSSATDGAEIYYSTANALSSENYESGTKYTDAGITITDAVTVHAIAVFTSTATGKKYFSEPSSAAYTILSVNDTVKFSPADGNSAVKVTDTITLTAPKALAESDTTTIYYSVGTELTSANYEDEGNVYTDAGIIIGKEITSSAETIYAIAVYSQGGASGPKYFSNPSSITYTNILSPPGAVEFTPKTGTSLKATDKITLSASNPFDSADTITIYYALDTELTAENCSTVGKQYETTGISIALNKATIVYAIAVGKNGPGPVSSATYEPPKTILNAPPETDDVVYIFYKSDSQNQYIVVNSSFASETPNRKRLSGTTITLDDNSSFKEDPAMAAFTVYKTNTGQYVFISGGKYLSDGNSGTGGTIELTDTFNKYCLWDIITTSDADTFKIRNSNAVYTRSNGTEFRQFLQYRIENPSSSTPIKGFSLQNEASSGTSQNFKLYKDSTKTSELDDAKKAELENLINGLK